MGKEFEKARQELYKRYKDAIQTAEADAKRLREENEQLRKANTDLAKKYTKLALFHELDENQQKRILQDDIIGEMSRRFLSSGFNIPFTVHATDSLKFADIVKQYYNKND